MARIANFSRPKNTRRAIKQMFGYLGRHKWYMFAIALLVAASAMANIMGTYLLKPVINNYILPGDIPGLIRMIALMGLMYALGASACLAYNQLMVHMSQQVVSEIRSDLFEHTQKLPLSYFDAHTHGELMSRFTNDVDTLTEALNGSFAMMIQSFITITGTITMLLILSWRLSLIVIFFLACMTLFIRYNSRRNRKYFIRQQQCLGSINGFVEEMVAGQKVEKVFNHEPQDFEEFCRRNEALRDAGTKALAYSGMTIPTIVSLSYFNYAVSACVGGLFALAGLTDLGTLASYLVYVRQSAMPMNQFTQQINFLLSALSGAERIFDMMDEIPEIDEGNVRLCQVRENPMGQLKECSEFTGRFAWKVPEETVKRTRLDAPVSDGFAFIPLKGDVRFNDVVFGYVPEKTILNGISLYAKPGQKIAFVGSTGAGKTTIINLVNRFYEVNGGSITYDGIDIREIRKDDLRRSMSMVIQDTHLFTGTIRENIAYGNLDASQEELIAAAKKANIHDYIMSLPEGYDTYIGERGVKLSGGQKQRISIARVFLKNPSILILDEATSALDNATEMLIQESLEELSRGRTSLIVAHRLSTIKNADEIIVFTDEGIQERGTHDSLLAQDGIYAQLYRYQFRT